MNPLFKYDPEDMESLLLHKQFHELYPEEKEFVLRHMSGREEYESLRRTLLELHKTGSHDEWLEPDPHLKRTLMAEFQRERRSGFTVWLNALFSAPAGPWLRRPAFQLALGTALIVGVAIMLWPDKKKPEFTELRKEENPLPAPKDSAIAGEQNTESTTALPNDPSAAIVSGNAEVPPAAVPVDEYMPTRTEDIYGPMMVAEEAPPMEESVTNSDLTESQASANQGSSANSAASAQKAQKEMVESDEVLVKSVSSTVHKNIQSAALSASMADKKDLLAALFTAR
jgi:hypothetical protein